MYRVGIYCRISTEDSKKGRDRSDSICSQIRIAEDYITGQNHISEVKVYIDEGASGSNFNRPGFSRMLTDIEHGIINMVIVKDISRLGREHIGTNYYLERYFPEKQIRVVSVLDRYDSVVSTYDELLELRTLLHDMYLRDISKKIRSAIRSKRKMGEYTPKEPPFGYVKSNRVRNHLEADPYAAGIVGRIYKMYLQGWGSTVISRTLNEEQIPSPARYKREIRKNGYPWNVGKGLWNPATVRRILKDPVYTGSVSLGKYRKTSWKCGCRKEISPEEMELIPDAHEAIISKEDFIQAQKIRKDRRVPCFNKSKEPHKYGGMLFCGKCQMNHITFEKLDELVVYAVNQQIRKLQNPGILLRKKEPEADRRIENLRIKAEKNMEAGKKIYEQFMDDILSREEYLEKKKIYEREKEQYQKELQEQKNRQQREKAVPDNTAKWLDCLAKGEITAEQLTRDVLVELIKRIYVYQNRRIEIHFTFRR